jgi:hypothetical protein
MAAAEKAEVVATNAFSVEADQPQGGSKSV